MAQPAVSKTVLQNGPRNYVATYTCRYVTDSLDPVANYVAANPTSAGDMGVNIAGNVLYPNLGLKIIRIGYDISNELGVALTWDDGSTGLDAYIINGTGSGKQFFKPQGGLYVPAGSLPNFTGKLLFNTLGTPADGDFMSIDLYLRKDIQQ